MGIVHWKQGYLCEKINAFDAFNIHEQGSIDTYVILFYYCILGV